MYGTRGGNTFGLGIEEGKDDSAERVRQDEENLPWSANTTLVTCIRLDTHIILPPDSRQRNGRALRDDQADGVVDNLHDGVGLGAELGGEDLGATSVSNIFVSNPATNTYGMIHVMGPRRAE